MPSMSKAKHRLFEPNAEFRTSPDSCIYHRRCTSFFVFRASEDQSEKEIDVYLLKYGPITAEQDC